MDGRKGVRQSQKSKLSCINKGHHVVYFPNQDISEVEGGTINTYARIASTAWSFLGKGASLWSVCVPPNPYVGNLIPEVMVVGGGAFGR